MNLFAQAIQTPNNGASNAEDFQPPTRNPQSTQTNLQTSQGPQSASGQDILSNENARIVVPVGDGDPQAQSEQTPAGGGIDWFLVIAIAAVIVVGLEYFFRRREKSQPVDTPAVIEVPQTTPEIVEETEPKPQPVKQTAAPKKKSSTNKKSKSKRKKSRK